MTKPPRPRKERLLDWRLLVRAYLFLGLLEAIVSMAAYFFVLHSGGWHWGESLEANDSLYLQATTACFSAIIVTQIVNVFLFLQNAGAQCVQWAIVRQSHYTLGYRPGNRTGSGY